MEIIGGLLMCLIIVGFVALLLFFTTRSEAKSKYYEDLYKYVPEEKGLDPNVSRTKAIKKILSQPGVREAAEKMKEERARNRAKNEDLDRKRDIERRVYSYKYEELIYHIFSPYAQKREKYPRGKWEWWITKGIDREFFCYEISRILNVSYDNACRLLSEFEKNGLISLSKRPHSLSTDCWPGYILSMKWNIISEYDNNFNRWMDSHINIESEENFNKRMELFLKTRY